MIVYNSDMEYKPGEFEPRWAHKWEEEGINKAVDKSDLQKTYLLIEFPYPSGDRLHVGHARSYCCLDAVARKRRMQGQNVLFPFGWDAFGLPAENFAVKTGVHPKITTRQNIEHAKKQVISWGLSFDWDREINTTDPEYYRWTQWIFVQLFNRGLAYKAEITVNWCPSCRINLANEEVVDGCCERCGTKTERRKQSQWLLRITAYADRLLSDLKTVNFREDIARQQINWIGKKEGAAVKFKIQITNNKSNSNDNYIEVFTTRIDTLFGVTYLVLAPEHPLVQEITNPKVKDYISKALNKSERERKQKTGKTGVDTELTAINPANGEKVPIWIADYVMMDVGTGAIMGVPGHDERDMEFAKEHNLEVRQVVEEGKLINSGKYTGMGSGEAGERMIKDGLGEKSCHYHLRDWVFSRQHYWGEPIPMINCSKCAENHRSFFTTSPLTPLHNCGEGNERGEVEMYGWFPVPEDQLPVELPEIEKYQPTQTGESPLAHIESFVQTTCPNCGGLARRETDTMPNWAGSSWYFLRYIDPHNDKALADPEKLKYWLPVDWYNGGMEHTTLHLLYSRFWHKFLFDLGVVPTSEPYAKRTSHGMILGPDSRKMSKSRGNVINPDEVVAKFGADSLRLYEMFIGPFDQTTTWSWESLEGVHRFLKRVWVLIVDSGKLIVESSGEAKNRMARLVNKIDRDLESMKFNTAVAALMEFLNWWTEHQLEVGKDLVEMFLRILAPLAPFITEELYQTRFGNKTKYISIHSLEWPKIKVENGGEKTSIVITVDGKVRGKVEDPPGGEAGQESVSKKALEMENVKKYIEGKVYKTVYVPGKILNFVIAHGSK